MSSERDRRGWGDAARACVYIYTYRRVETQREMRERAREEDLISRSLSAHGDSREFKGPRG